MTEYHQLPQPSDIPIKEKEDAMGGYLMMFAALAAGLPLPIINLLAAMIYFYLNRKISRFVYFHSLQSLLSQLPTSLLNAGVIFWTLQILIWNNGSFNNIFFGYLAMTIIANLLYVLYSIIGAMKARKGQMYYFLYFGSISYHYAFRIKANEEKNEVINKPPSI
jgi:uncharacterized membrane protein